MYFSKWIHYARIQTSHHQDTSQKTEIFVQEIYFWIQKKYKYFSSDTKVYPGSQRKLNQKESVLVIFVNFRGVYDTVLRYNLIQKLYKWKWKITCYNGSSDSCLRDGQKWRQHLILQTKKIRLPQEAVSAQYSSTSTSKTYKTHQDLNPFGTLFDYSRTDILHAYPCPQFLFPLAAFFYYNLVMHKNTVSLHLWCCALLVAVKLCVTADLLAQLILIDTHVCVQLWCCFFNFIILFVLFINIVIYLIIYIDWGVIYIL